MNCGSVGLPWDFIARGSFPWVGGGGNACAQSCGKDEAPLAGSDGGTRRTGTRGRGGRGDGGRETRLLRVSRGPECRPVPKTRQEIAMNQTTPDQEKQARTQQARAADRAESSPAQQAGTHPLG